jgi:type VI secretion system protein ImpB
MTARNTVPRSRITLTYDTRQPDQPRQEKELPLRLLVLGDLTGRQFRGDPAPGTPPPPADEFEDRKIHDLNGRNLDAVMKKMNLAIELTGVANHAEKAGPAFDVKIPITSMASFEPGEVVKHVPTTQRLLRIRTLLLELQSCVDNNKQFRRLVRDLTSPARAALLEDMRAAFNKEQAALLRIPTEAELADDPAPTTPGAGGNGAANTIAGPTPTPNPTPTPAPKPPAPKT